MNTLRSFSLALLLGVLPGLGACSAGSSGDNGSTHSTLDRTIASAMDKAREKLRTQNIDIDSDHASLPRAEISPQGDLLIAGKPIAITPQQRALLLQYRGKIIDVAEAGMAIGTQGADLGMRAAGEALSAVFSGKSDEQIEQKVEAQASGIRQAAAKLCDRLPAMREAQQKLADALPAFRPYARMTSRDIDDCRRDVAKKDHADSSAHY